MSELSYSERLDKLETSLCSFFANEGFRHAKRNFRRETAPGVVQVINFQMRAPGASPGGLFTINLAVYIDDVHAILNAGNHPPKTITEPDCEFRVRLFTLEREGSDRWLSLDDSVETLAAEIQRVLSDYGLPLLKQYSTRHLIAEGWQRQGTSVARWIGRSVAAVGIVLAKDGKVDQATEILQRWCDDSNPIARPMVRRIARKLNLQLKEAESA